MQELIEQILQGFMLVAALGLMFIILYQIFRLATGLFLIGFISGLILIEVYGIYLVFTERYLYTEDLAANGILSFTGFFIVLNILLVFGLMTNIVRSRMT
ncbi:TPA: DUF5966 family protein [Streptococcus suis]